MTDRTVELRAQAAKVDVVDLAGAIIANPIRGTIGASQAGTLALALAFERAWEIVVEAHVLVIALERTMPWEREPGETDGDYADRCEHAALSAGEVLRLIRAFTQPAETNTTNKQES